jgi:O-antigen/teichoic acid export membrane protein
MRRKDTILNFVMSVVSNILILAMGLIIPRILMTHYGSDTNGLMSTITQIFTYVALLEAGIGQATLNALYKPLREQNKEDVISVLYASRRYYRKVTYIYALAVIGLAIVLPFIIKSDLSYPTILFAVLFEGASGVVTFYFVQTQSIFLVADGKTYIKSIIDLIMKIGGYGVKIILSLFYINIVYIQLGFFLLSLVKVLLYHYIMKRKYKWLDYSKCTNKSVQLPNRNDYVITELAWTLFSSTDLIVLSLFASTKMSSVYSVNSMVFAALANLAGAAYNGIYYLLGRAYYEGLDSYKKMHDVFNSFFMAIITIFMCVALLLSESFIKIYTTGVSDIEYNLYWLPLCFCLVHIFSWSRYVSGNLTGIAGYAKQVSKISLIEAMTNVVLSVILVRIWGIYGVVLATVIALPLKVIYTNYLADKVIMQRSPRNTLLILGTNYGIFGITIFVRRKLLLNIDNYFSFVKYGILLTIIYTAIVFGLNIVVNKDILMLISKKGSSQGIPGVR